MRHRLTVESNNYHRSKSHTTSCYPHFVSPLLIVFPFPLILLPGARLTHLLAGKQLDASTSNPVNVAPSFEGTGPYLLDDENRPLHKTTCGKYGSQMLSHSMDANRIRSDQFRPLRVASYYRMLGVVQLLLERGTKVDVEATSKCAIPLHWGVYESQEDDTHLGRLLLERDLDVSAQGEEKWTPFHAASYYGKLEIVRLFCGLGAEANAEADNGNT
ncbi:ankyrin repeat-containing domain protein [Lactarius deliciosus]|nr:ankyrin repeat-containing domain protein [Lactarius deliciosus]